MKDPIIILFGGDSNECRVSVASAQNILQNLPNAEAWFLSRKGEVFRCPPKMVIEHKKTYENDFIPDTIATWKSLEKALEHASQLSAIIVLALHGGDGENGNIQQKLERLNIVFTGSGSQASKNAFNKIFARELVKQHGIQIAEGIIINPNNLSKIRRKLEDFFNIHKNIVIKPVSEGSSVGLRFIRKKQDIIVAAEQISSDSVDYLAEELIEGIELTVGVVEDEKGIRSLPVTEVKMDAGRSFDFSGKYFGKGSKEITPAEISSEAFSKAQKLAISAHCSLGCEGYSRTDLMVDSNRFIFLEINTLPGLTKASFLPQQLNAEGTPLKNFLMGQISLAAKKRRQ